MGSGSCKGSMSRFHFYAAAYTHRGETTALRHLRRAPFLRVRVYAPAKFLLQSDQRQVSPIKFKDAIVYRFKELLNDRQMRPNELATRSGVTPSTVYSMFDPARRDLSVVTVKKLCDGLGISVPEFFSADLFQNLEQELH